MPLNLVLWNANGLSHHSLELNSFLLEHNIDVLLVSENHFTSKSHFVIPGYSLYNTNHPDGTAHGGSAILINTSIRHVLAEKYEYDEIQATTITADDEDGKLTISTIYKNIT